MSYSDNTFFSGLSKPMKGCAIAAAAVMVLLIGLLVFMSRIPSVRSMVKCTENMNSVYGAIERYKEKNNNYPSKLENLKDYLQDTTSLKCPLDDSPGNKPSYMYSIPPNDADNKFVLLECDRHHLMPNAPNSKLRILSNGDFVTVNPSPAEIERYQKNKKNK